MRVWNDGLAGGSGWLCVFFFLFFFLFFPPLRKVPVELNSRLADLCRRCFLPSPSHQPSAYPCQLARYVTETEGSSRVFCRTSSTALSRKFRALPAPLFPSVRDHCTQVERSAWYFRAVGRRPCLEGEFKCRYLFRGGGGKNRPAIVQSGEILSLIHI